MNKQENVDNKQKKHQHRKRIHVERERGGGGEGEDPYMHGTSNSVCVCVLSVLISHYGLLIHSIIVYQFLPYHKHVIMLL